MALETLIVLLVIAAVLAYGTVKVLRLPAAETPQAEPLCQSCKFFELEGAQQAVALNPAFVRMTHTMSPYQAGRKVQHSDGGPCPDCDPKTDEPCKTCSGDRRVLKTEYVYPDPAKLALNAKWSEYGWCTNPNVVYEDATPFNERIMWGGTANCEGKLFQLRAK